MSPPCITIRIVPYPNCKDHMDCMAFCLFRKWIPQFYQNGSIFYLLVLVLHRIIIPFMVLMRHLLLKKFSRLQVSLNILGQVCFLKWIMAVKYSTQSYAFVHYPLTALRREMCCQRAYCQAMNKTVTLYVISLGCIPLGWSESGSVI